jgi:beta-lactamase class D
MKNIILFLTLGLLLDSPSIADTKCFLIMENNQVTKKEGECKSRHSPCSTFKIAISLMA